MCARACFCLLPPPFLLWGKYFSERITPVGFSHDRHLLFPPIYLLLIPLWWTSHLGQLTPQGGCMQVNETTDEEKKKKNVSMRRIRWRGGRSQTKTITEEFARACTAVKSGPSHSPFFRVCHLCLELSDQVHNKKNLLQKQSAWQNILGPYLKSNWELFNTLSFFFFFLRGWEVEGRLQPRGSRRALQAVGVRLGWPCKRRAEGSFAFVLVWPEGWKSSGAVLGAFRHFSSQI